MEKKRLILGPSHIMRWVQSIDCHLIPTPKNMDFHGRGGASIWGDFIKSKTNDFSQYDEILFIVGDFRFGNKSLVDSTLTRNQHGIAKELINDANDREMYQKVIDELYLLSSSENQSKIKFIFWDLALREFKNKQNRKYFKNGSYAHPIWNLGEVQSLFAENTILMDSDTNLDSLFIDGSNHPSFQGYVYLYYLIFGKKHHHLSLDLFPEHRLSEQKIIGDSTLIKHVNMFCEKGILNTSYKLQNVKLFQLEDFLVKNQGAVTYVTNIRASNERENDFYRRVKKLSDLKDKYGSRLQVLFWEAYAQEIISTREKSYSKFVPENPFYKHNTLASIFGTESIYPKKESLVGQSLVELNVGLQPTIKAILWLFMQREHSLVEIEKRYTQLKQLYFGEVCGTTL
ncbi:hypothetical protein [Pseudoalteromonas carrageenovora]|uniref:hypothetical protein n=1 Tax=Pseudoalteromonas carrageenovora TaxID=227 RepID=UPI0026E273B8|nr:hypothetical protein [Pseudoalteromonas carrageenovora]MDO6463644.1 hypothetical protein [Pseudoalteromonas carrageenovora]